MDEAKRKALVETLKSMGRGLYFGFLGLVAVVLAALATSGAIADINVTIAGMSLDLAYIIVAVVGFVAKTIDIYVRKNTNIDRNGIAPEFLQR